MALGVGEQLGAELVDGGDLVGELLDEEELVDEPRVDLRGVEDLLRGGAGADGLHDRVDPAVGGPDGLAQQLGLVARLAGEGEWLPFFSRERSAFWRASVKLRPMAIASPTDFMVVVRVESADGNFSKAKRGTLTTT